MSNDIWLGDLARALRVLGPIAPEQRAAVAEMLGLADAVPAERTGAADQAGSRNDQLADAPKPPESALSAPRSPELNPNLPLLPSLDPSTASQSYLWRGSPLPAPESRPHSLASRLQPLLAPCSAEAILRTVVARTVPGGPVDTRAVVRTMARQKVVRSVPRMPVVTLRFGAQVMVDLGRGMEPFTGDRRAVIRQLRRIVGQDSLTIQYFSHAPLRGVSSRPSGRLGDYQLPAPGTRILLLSDLGLGGIPGDYRRGRREEWEAFADLTARNYCWVTALVPFPPKRWPSWLGRLFPLISWDRSTTVAEAAHRVWRR
jgi:hypothetical protein